MCKVYRLGKKVVGERKGIWNSNKNVVNIWFPGSSKINLEIWKVNIINWGILGCIKVVIHPFKFFSVD